MNTEETIQKVGETTAKVQAKVKEVAPVVIQKAGEITAKAVKNTVSGLGFFTKNFAEGYKRVKEAK